MITLLGPAWMNSPLLSSMMKKEPNVKERSLVTLQTSTWKSLPVSHTLHSYCICDRERAVKLAHKFTIRLNEALRINDTGYLVSDHVTAADISAFCILDFGATLAEVPIDKSLVHLLQWYTHMQGTYIIFLLNSHISLINEMRLLYQNEQLQVDLVLQRMKCIKSIIRRESPLHRNCEE